MAMSPMARQGSLAAVLGSWQAGPSHNLQQHPVGSLEALRSTWHAPHNSLGHPVLSSTFKQSFVVGSASQNPRECEADTNVLCTTSEHIVKR